jgi:UDP-glucose 4-epimerase
MPGVRVEVTESCVGCGKCTEDVCFINAVSLEDGRAVISEDCRGCGNCAEVCPQGAIRVIIEREDYIQNAIARLSQAVDVR